MTPISIFLRMLGSFSESTAVRLKGSSIVHRNTVVDYQDGVPVDPIFSKGLSWNVLSLREGLNPIRPEALAKKIGWTMKSVEEYCRKGVLGKRNRPVIDTPRQ